MYTIAKQFSFSAAHRIDGLPDDHPCSRMHGHNYEVVVILASPTLGRTGFVLDYRELSKLKTWIDDTWDHRVLNDCEPFVTGTPTTAECIAAAVFGTIRYAFPAWPVVAVRISETPRTWAEYRP